MACPFRASAAAFPAVSEAHDDISKCPMHATLKAQEEQPAATCPLGFGSSRGPKLSSLHCPICKGLLFDAHVLNCKHTFCRPCINKTQHYGCPICGEDVQSVEPNTEVAGLIDTFLDTHSKSPQLVAAQADLGPLPDNSPASFFMAQGLKSLSGGNIHAAIHRLGRCREALLGAAAAGQQPGQQQQQQQLTSVVPGVSQAHEQQSTGQGKIAGALAAEPQQEGSIEPPTTGVSNGATTLSATSAVCQLAAVCGCLADCYQRLGDISQAEQLYQDSINSVKQFSEADAEAAHAMSVSLNKLGDLRYTQQQLQDAKQLYKQALGLREMYCGPLTKGEAGFEQQLELASSLIKVADVCRALDDSEEADKLFHRAQGVCLEVQHAADDLPAHVSRKLLMLLDVLQSQCQAAAGSAGQAAAAE